jgi:hypothetical protein
MGEFTFEFEARLEPDYVHLHFLRLRNYMSKPWFADGLLGRELGADLSPEVTAQINKVLADNHKHSLSANGEVPTKGKTESAVSALADTMKEVSVGVRSVNGVGKVVA